MVQSNTKETAMIKVGIIGGSGLGDPQLIENPSQQNVTTDFGTPSSPLTTGHINNIPVVVLARHGMQHTILPSQIPFRANIQALKDQGCTHIIAASACGSLREEIAPGDLIFPSQFIDMTKQRNSSFFDSSTVVHTPMAEPFCQGLRKLLEGKALQNGFKAHTDKTVVTIEGPRFSTQAESHMFRSWGADIINMTTVPEVCLARELNMHYQIVAMATDYDCWKQDHEAVTMEMAFETMRQNADKVKALIKTSLAHIKNENDICTDWNKVK